MSIGRITTVLIYELENSFIPSDAKTLEKFTLINDSSNITLDKFTSSSYSNGFSNYTEHANYVGLEGHNLTAKLIAGEFNEKLTISGGSTTNFQVLPEDVQNISKSVSITKSSSTEIDKKYQYFANISLSFIRSEIGRILFLIILMNIFSLVPHLIGDDKKKSTDKEKSSEKIKKLNLFIDLILTTLVLGLLLTLLPQGDIGGVILSVDSGTGISAFIIIIAFIFVSWFKMKFIDEKNETNIEYEERI